MDVLFGSIDVRELLSTTDLDSSSPLSVPDLRVLIDRLQIRSLHIKKRVQDYIISHHSEFSDIFANSSSAVSKTDDISNDVGILLDLISNHPIDNEIREIVDEIGRRKKELIEKQEVLGMVKLVVGLVERLKGVRESLRVGKFVDAAEGVRDLRIGLCISGEGNEVVNSEPKVFGLLRKEWMDCFEQVEDVFANFMSNAVRFEGGEVRVKCRVSVGGVEEVEVRTVLTAMEVIGVLDYGLAKVADLFVKFVVIPTVSNGYHFDFVEDDIEGMDEAVLYSVSSSDSKVEIPCIYSRIIRVIKFIYNFVCLRNGRWMRCFGRLSWPQISELIISNFLSKAIPDDASKLPEFQKIIEVTSEFETALEEIEFISGTDDKDRRLSDYAQNIEVGFASRKKKELMAKARNLILQCDFSVPPEYTRKSNSLNAHGVAEDFPEQTPELLFMPERCIISKAGAQLMELVHQVLQDICLSSARVSREFYYAARDVLLLYEAIIPVQLEKQLNSINQVAIIVHNDCLFLSQEILGLAFQYRLDFPASLKEQAVFVDLAPRYGQMAGDILRRQIQLVNINLKEAVDGADGFQNTHQMQQYECAKFSIDQIVFTLEKVRMIWEPLLLPSTYKRSMCTILDFVLSRILEDILLLDDMAAEETLQVQRLIHMLLHNLSSLFESLNVVYARKKLQEDIKHVSLEDLIPSLPKLQKLADLLDMPLKSITNAWEIGELVKYGFTSSEVENFVKAIYTDSPLRKECLRRICSGSW